MSGEPMNTVRGLFAELERYALPAGWGLSVQPGWQIDPLNMADGGPEGYAAAISGHEVVEWAGKTFPATFVMTAWQLEAEPGRYMRLYMALSLEHDVRIMAVASVDDITESLEALFDVRPEAWWKTKALVDLGIARGDHPLGIEDASADLRASTTEVESWLAGIVLPTRTTQRRRNNKITPSLLSEVAQVYRQALAVGEPPTIAVKDHFGISRANAAKWVSRAREERLLGPSVGPAAGEGPLDE